MHNTDDTSSDLIFTLLIAATLLFLLFSAAFWVYADHKECMVALEKGVEFAEAVCK